MAAAIAGWSVHTVLGCGLVLDLLEFAASSLCTRILRSPWNQGLGSRWNHGLACLCFWVLSDLPGSVDSSPRPPMDRYPYSVPVPDAGNRGLGTSEPHSRRRRRVLTARSLRFSIPPGKVDNAASRLPPSYPADR